MDNRLQAKIALLTTMIREIRLIPLACYSNVDKRETLQEAAAEALDRLIAIEEELEELEEL